MVSRPARSASIALAALLLVAARVGAQTPSEVAAARAAFDEGKRLMAAGRLAEACARFETAAALARRQTILLNLGDCLERVGRTASAYGAFAEAEGVAREHRDLEVVREAGRRGAALAPRLTRLRLRAPGIAGLEVTLGGRPLRIVGVEAIPVDPGDLELVASAPGHRPWRARIQLEPGRTVEVDVPALESEGSEGAPPPRGPRDADRAPSPGGLDGADVAGGDEPRGRPASRVRRRAALGLGGLGVGALAIGGVAGGLAGAWWSDARAHCDAELACDAEGVRLAGDARAAARISDAAFVTGAALVATAVVLHVTAPRRRAPRVTLAPAPGGGAALTVTGGF